MEFINSQDGIERADPETFKFNTTLMSGFRLALRFIKLPAYETQLTGNAKVLWEIFDGYRTHEGKLQASNDLHPNHALPAQHRFDILSKGIPAAIFKYFFDSAYREVGDWFLWEIIKNAHRFKFPPHHLDPDCWFKDYREGDEPDGPGHRLTPGLVIHPDDVISADDNAIVVKGVLQPKNYFVSIDGIDRWVSVNTNFPQWVGNGWAYRVHAVYGTQKELETKTLLGE